MKSVDIVLVLVLVATFVILVCRPVRNNRNWSATITPLASIIGSGILVSVPLLAGAIGIWAVAAIAGLAVLSFLLGGAIRYNIRYGEPVIESARAGHTIRSIEGLSHLVLAGAYFIAVAYYLMLLAAFGMKLLGWHDPVLGKIAATVLISGICGVGALKGLGGVERIEKFTVSANLAAIAAMLVALAMFGIDLPSGYGWTATADDTPAFDWDTVRFLMGLLIVVQGFETTRFMGEMYDPDTRIGAMKRAQIVSSLIYVVFFVLMIPLFPYFTSTDDVAGLIDVIGRVTPWLPFVVVAGAISSQFSAAVADSIGASGLISDATHRFIDARHAYLIIGAVSVFVIWETDVVSLVALASRAFALFYACSAWWPFLSRAAKVGTQSLPKSAASPTRRPGSGRCDGGSGGYKTGRLPGLPFRCRIPRWEPSPDPNLPAAHQSHSPGAHPGRGPPAAEPLPRPPMQMLCAD